MGFDAYRQVGMNTQRICDDKHQASTSSIPLDPQDYEGKEYFSRFKPRIHRDTILADRGSWQCQKDFLRAGGAADADRNAEHKSYAVGCINTTVGNFTALCACESIPDRLELITYMVEYAYIHDDVIEYAEDKSTDQLEATNRAHFEGLTTGNRTSTKESVRRRHLQAKMATQLLEVDAERGSKCLKLWKEMSETFVDIRDQQWNTLDDYLAFRAVDAGCPWTMSLLCIAYDFSLNDDETALTESITTAAYFAWCLVNDYFSFDKEWQNYEANDRKGEITSSVFLYMKWYGIDSKEAKRRMRTEIVAREQYYVDLKASLAARGAVTPTIERWFTILDVVTAGNHAWSMTTARYHHGVNDPYRLLRTAQREAARSEIGTRPRINGGSMNDIARSWHRMNSLIDDLVWTPKTEAPRTAMVVNGDAKSAYAPNTNGHLGLPSAVESGYEGDAVGAEALSKMQGPSLESFSETVLEPSSYIESLPSKGVRNSVLDALEVWYQVPVKSFDAIREIVDLLHSASLMIDDVQDRSQLRRGFPSCHSVFGVSRTINAANHMMVKATKVAQSISSAAATIVIDRLLDGHLGQGMDIYWTEGSLVPTIAEYFSMVDGKTGALFLLIAELMHSEASTNKDLILSAPFKFVGRFFQARDDYQNLNSTEYESQKGFAEDISEGKLSLPVIHALQSPQHRGRLTSIFQQRKAAGDLSLEMRRLALDNIRAAGGLDFAKKIILELQSEAWRALHEVERQCGIDNWILRLVLKKLEI